MSVLPRYLPLFTADGNWIERPDLYLLARMGVRDSENDDVALQVYQAMCRSDNTTSTLSSFDQIIEKGQVRRDIHRRVMAGEVVLEMARIAASTSGPPTLAKAVDLAVFNHHREFSKSSPESLERVFRRGFSQYRNTAHLQATLVEARYGVDFESSLEETIVFLSRARAFELFIDNQVVKKVFRWSPWRVPTSVPIHPEFNAPPLSEEERAVIGEG